VNHRIFERTLRPVVFRGACLFERHYTTQASLGIGRRGTPRASNLPAGSNRPSALWKLFAKGARFGHAVKQTNSLKVDLGSGRDTR
jgi:hypothetical protein